MMTVLRAIGIFVLLTSAATAQIWDVPFAQRGPNGPVTAIAFHGGDLYVGGEFTEVDGVAANNVARWNGSRWMPLAGGVGGRVNAIAASDAGVFVGGDFDSADGRPMHHLALFSNDAWQSLDGQDSLFDRPVNAIAIAGDDVFVGGEFRLTIDGAPEQSIAVWSMRDRVWRGLGGGVRVRIASWGNVLAIATNDRYAYVAGLFSFVNVGGPEIGSAGIARWDRQEGRWDSLGGVVGVEEGALEIARALAIDGSHVYALGDFASVDGVAVDGAARFDESLGVWQDVGLHGLSFNSAVAARSNQVFAANASDLSFPDDALLRWDGVGAWRESGAAIEGSIYTLAYSPTGDLYVGGEFASARGESVRNIIRLTTSPLAVNDAHDAAGTTIIRSLSENLLRFMIPRATSVDARIMIHDILGRELASYAPGVIEPGEHAIRVDRALPRVCVVTIRSGGTSESRVVEVQR